MSRVDRSVTEVRAAPDDKQVRPASAPLKEYREVPAYVLLGDPGAGKTTAFEMECEALADGARPIDARDFVTFDPGDHPEWRGKTLFIDALDEVRAGSHDARTPFDAIRGRLDKLGRPRFRLSCREADWLGENDRNRLASVVPHDSHVTVLRLDPLARADVERILAARTDITDARGFIEQAAERGVDALLGNPLTLDLLADVVSREQCWPGSRLDLFEQATALLTTERNEEHSTARPQPPTAELLDAAGRLCAVLLLSGATGYALHRCQANAEYLDIDQCAYEQPHRLRPALATRLFTARAEGRFEYIHRHIAEFVAAKHLAGVISESLPVSRVVALLTGFDGGVVTSLRGLAAWLAALSEGARRDLIERDPIGVICYGDVSRFTAEHRRALFRALIRETSQLNSEIWNATLTGAITTPDMEPELRAFLECRDQIERAQVEFVLDAVGHGQRLPGLSDSLFDILYDYQMLPVKGIAVAAFVYHCTDDDYRSKKLQQLLADITTDKVEDWGDALAAVALRYLYPAAISPSTIWDHLTESKDQYAVDYRNFWRSDLVKRSTDAEVAVLLDELVARGTSLKPALQSRRLEKVPVQLLARGLYACGDGIDDKRRLRWLRMDLFPGKARAFDDVRPRIGDWLRERPEVQKQIIADYLSTGGVVLTDSKASELLFGSPLPSDFGFWCLEQSEATTDRRMAREYLRHARDHDVPLDTLLNRTGDHEILRDEMRKVLVCRIPPNYFDGSVAGRGILGEIEERHREFIELVRSNVDALQENRCPVGLLHELALAYFGLSSDAEGLDPRARISDLCDRDEHLIDATLVGLRRTPFRDDLPETRNIVGKMQCGETYLVALPYLAGIDELDDLDVLSERQFRHALAFHFCSSVEDMRDREARLLMLDHDAAANMLVRCIGAKMRNGEYDAGVAHRLATDEYALVAKRAVLPLLRAFPVRCSKTVPLIMLDDLLVTALRRADRSTLVDLIIKKRSRASMGVSQRVHWLAAEVVATGGNSTDRLREFVNCREHRVAQLAEFLFAADSLLADLPASTLACFICVLAPSTRRLGGTAPHLVGTEYKAYRSVERMIDALANHGTGGQAVENLDRLAIDPALAEWRYPLATARDRQRVVLRDTAYQHPTVEQVCHTLNAGTPANAGDLAALLTDRVFELARRIRTGNTDDWRQYWNEPRGKEPTPKHEDHCRDALLSDLRQRLPAGVDAQPEGQYANDKRADIRVACQDFEVPVEIKKNRHRDLWSAARNQLVAKYASAPATSGYGIYLVFWLGKDRMPPPPTGAPPSGPDELQQRLEATLSDAERRKISVVVIDVSRP